MKIASIQIYFQKERRIFISYCQPFKMIFFLENILIIFIFHSWNIQAIFILVLYNTRETTNVHRTLEL